MYIIHFRLYIPPPSQPLAMYRTASLLCLFLITLLLVTVLFVAIYNGIVMSINALDGILESGPTPVQVQKLPGEDTI